MMIWLLGKFRKTFKTARNSYYMIAEVVFDNSLVGHSDLKIEWKWLGNDDFIRIIHWTLKQTIYFYS